MLYLSHLFGLNLATYLYTHAQRPGQEARVVFNTVNAGDEEYYTTGSTSKTMQCRRGGKETSQPRDEDQHHPLKV